MLPRRSFAALAVSLGLLAGCGKNETEQFRVLTSAVERRTIVMQAEATGVIEPINVVEVKSRASGQITEMPVETGTLVRPGDLIVQLDTRDVQNQFDQAKADLESSEASLAVAEQNKRRSDELFRAQIITAQENEQAGLTYQNALSQIVRARTNLDLAQQRLEDARVVAPVGGTIIAKPVALGQVIQSGTQAVGGGTTIVQMADLTKVRARALVNETDIGRVQAGQEATVIVDAFPDRPFNGVVEKIEPQAVVQQNVTMFPVLVSLENREGLLLPGMNGEVSIISDRRENVVAVSNEAIRSVREAAQAAEILGIDPDSVQAQIRGAMGGMFGGGNGMAPGARPAGNGGGATARPGFTELGQQQGRQGGGQMPQVTDAQCKAVTDARTAKPAVANKLDSLQALMRDPNADRQALFGQVREAYTELGVDPMIVRACTARTAQQRAGNGASGPAATTNTPAGTPTPARSGPRSLPAPGAAGAARQGGQGGQGRNGSRTGLVFVQRADSTWEARVVRLGVADYDYTEVLSGLEEGETVALLSAAALQMQQRANTDRFRQMTGGGSPLGGATGGGRR